MRVRLLYFARVRDFMGCSEDTVEIDTAKLDGAGLIDWMAAKGARHCREAPRPEYSPHHQSGDRRDGQADCGWR